MFWENMLLFSYEVAVCGDQAGIDVYVQDFGKEESRVRVGVVVPSKTVSAFVGRNNKGDVKYLYLQNLWKIILRSRATCC